ncbi:16S rRNA (cytosine(1402)-N(4))-methyltransferase RsmH [Catenovulum sp. 2E275]|uniref:16S rRNA (cytosine(1402)-N(4))-methyltransferase RsmH n=1 Tax=Catenovulum sp. 2E275 TaxID=2980497 RepID=UPI0021CEBBFB|nr:16S rRNA (cytosine(1402)-N(4))-methyltransferase RsmH [Catenovulum sp. 2E275]MCU4674220.1 16S rRNA (cytosine(1402)-N(4))-methyltransferase RsmH [Catenovulum sp. 2E275]
MQPESGHISVLLQESVDALAIKPDGVYVDCTFGRGGHSRLILNQLGESGKLIAIDQDPTAIAWANEHFNQANFEIVRGNFRDLADIIEARGLTGKVDGVLADLGVSSPQLDEAERGFSFMRDGPLDMRMNPDVGESASEWLQHASEDEIAYVLKEYGEERFARKIARAIVHDRVETPFTRTAQLAGLLGRIIKKKEPGKNPATRSFQAIRIQVNGELDAIKQVLESAVDVVKKHGRISVISFHSLEDRIVKRFFNEQSKAKAVPRGLPVTDAELNKDIKLKLIGKAIKPSDAEITMNPRARSSVLRVAERAVD